MVGEPLGPARTITTIASPLAGGITSGGGQYQDGQLATVVATHNVNYVFVNWTYTNGLEASKLAAYSFSVTGSVTLTANFAAVSQAPVIQVLRGPTIAAGQSLSNVLAVAGGALFRVIMPDDWLAAPITFQISYEGVEYYDVYLQDGTEYSIKVVPRSIVVFSRYFMNVGFIKVRSGTLRQPVVQPQDRQFKMVIDTSVVPQIAAGVGLRDV